VAWEGKLWSRVQESRYKELLLGYDGVLLESLVWEDRHRKFPLLASFLIFFLFKFLFFFCWKCSSYISVMFVFSFRTQLMHY